MKKIGFIGLGIMGFPMAKNLCQAGFQVIAADISEAACKRAADCGIEIGNYQMIGEQCDIIVTILPNGKIVKQVLFGEDGIITSVRKGSLVIDMSSVTPVESRECYQGLKKHGIGFLDAPVSGGEPGAINGTLAFMVGGDQEEYERALPIFQVLGSSSLLIGESGSGSITKLANQIIVNLNIAAVSEALVFAVKAGVDPEKVYEAIRGGLAGSAVLDAKAPMIINRNFTPGGKIAINRKDINNVLETAHMLDIPTPLSANLFEIMQNLKVSGQMEEDHSSIVKYFERLAGVEVKKKTEETL